MVQLRRRPENQIQSLTHTHNVSMTTLVQETFRKNTARVHVVMHGSRVTLLIYDSPFSFTC